MAQNGLSEDMYGESNTMQYESEIRSKTNSTSTGQILYDEKNLKKKIKTNRVCCFQIKKNWTIKKQMLISLCILSGSVFLLVLGIVNGNVFLTKFLIASSSEDAINSQVTENLHNSATEYSSAILEIFTGYSSTLEILSRIALSAMKLDNTIFDFDYVKEFPLIGQGYLDGQSDYYNFYLNQEIPSSLTKTSDKYPENYPGSEYTFDKWQYGAFSNANLQSTTTKSSQINAAMDILNYFLEDFYFNKNVTHIYSIYFAWEEEKLIQYFPGGLLNETQIKGYDPHSREWYQKTKQTYEQDNSLKLEMIISGPYESYNQNNTIVTISKAVVDMYGDFMGVCSIDMLFQDLQSIISKVRFYETGFLVFISIQNEYILNDPYNVGKNVKIYETQYTGLDQSDWEQIKDQSTGEDQRLTLQDKRTSNPEENEVIIIRNFITTNVPDQNFILMVQVPKKEAYKFLTELQILMDDSFQEIQIYTFVSIVITCLLSIISGMYYSNKIVTPLAKLTEYAKSINQNATKKQFAEGIKIDLDKIQAQDKIGELIEAFKSLVKGLSGIKKGIRTEISAGNEKITFPKNYYQNTQMSWRPLIDQLEDFDQNIKTSNNNTNSNNNIKNGNHKNSNSNNRDNNYTKNGSHPILNNSNQQNKNANNINNNQQSDDLIFMNDIALENLDANNDDEKDNNVLSELNQNKSFKTMQNLKQEKKNNRVYQQAHNKRQSSEGQKNSTNNNNNQKQDQQFTNQDYEIYNQIKEAGLKNIIDSCENNNYNIQNLIYQNNNINNKSKNGIKSYEDGKFNRPNNINNNNNNNNSQNTGLFDPENINGGSKLNNDEIISELQSQNQTNQKLTHRNKYSEI